MASISAGVLLISRPATAQLSAPGAATAASAPSATVGNATPEAAAPPTPNELPPPASDTSGAQHGDGAEVAGSTAGNKSDWKFSWNGYFRAPLRIGVGSRTPCPAGQTPSHQALLDLGAFKASMNTPLGNAYNGSTYNSVYCAAPGQSATTFHSPYIPDDQYLAWNYTRQWEQAWAEVFLSYSNDQIKGTVGIQAYDFTDASMLGNQASPAQFGIGQGWVTITPDVPLQGASLAWKVGAFWEKFGMAGKYDGGPYDTYMFGRTHQMGEALAGAYQAGDFTFKLEHGFGAHLEMVPAGIPVGGSQTSLNYVNYNGYNNNYYPPGASPGFTLLNHLHAGVAYRKKLDFNVHYLAAWSQDDRVEGTLGSSPNSGGALNSIDSSAQPDGHLTVVGAEARVAGGYLGDLYLAYSHIDAKNVTTVGPAIEVLHSQGGGGHNAGNGIYENFFNGVGNGTGQIDSLQLYYNGRFNIGPVDLKYGLFGMYSTVYGTDATSMNLLTGTATTGTEKLKYGADLLANVLPWLGVGVRGDYVQPDSHDTNESFGVISPKLVFRTKFVTHEEITLQYSHYWDGSDVLPQQWLSAVGPKNIATQAAYVASTPLLKSSTTPGGYVNYAGPAYPNDSNVFGIKATMWW
ncbi:MAG: hypothetical protein ABTD50_02845 [Polyangiaceae bacterium]|jgi:hypothetical protein